MPVLHFRQRRTKPRPQVTRTENIVKFGHVVLRHTRGQTYRHADRYSLGLLRTPSGTGSELINLLFSVAS